MTDQMSLVLQAARCSATEIRQRARRLERGKRTRIDVIYKLLDKASIIEEAVADVESWQNEKDTCNR